MPKMQRKTLLSVRFCHIHNRALLENVFAWLMTCAKNLAINQYRRRKREDLASSEAKRYWEITLAGSDNNLEARLHRKELILAARAALDRALTPLEKRCLLLRSRGVTLPQKWRVNLG